MIGKYFGFGKKVLQNIRKETTDKIYNVTSLADDNSIGTLRYAIDKIKSERFTKILFQIDGEIVLKKALNIECNNLILDGAGRDIIISNYPINITESKNILIQNLSVRGNDLRILEENKKQNVKRPKSSIDLDVINIDRCNTIAVYHCSLYWSADEIVSVTRSQNVTIGYCIMAYPLSNPKIHPYGDDHAYCSNNSASTVTYHHNIFAHYVMRGPQFEANDNQDNQSYNAQFEAINNVVFGYTQSGSRYSIGFEKKTDYVKKITIDYQLIGNIYINTAEKAIDIEVIDRYGSQINYPNKKPSSSQKNDRINFAIFDNVSINDNPLIDNKSSDKRLFDSGIPIQKTEKAYKMILSYCGNYLSRSVLDHSVISDIVTRAKPKIAHSVTEFN